MSPIDEYLAHLNSEQKAELERIRTTIHATVPEVEEGFSYGMPAFKYKDEYLIWFAAFKDHMSLFPTTTPIRELKDKLKDFKLSKGTIQFTLENPMPEALIKEILHVRLAEIDKS